MSNNSIKYLNSLTEKITGCAVISLFELGLIDKGVKWILFIDKKSIYEIVSFVKRGLQAIRDSQYNKNIYSSPCVVQ